MECCVWQGTSQPAALAPFRCVLCVLMCLIRWGGCKLRPSFKWKGKAAFSSRVASVQWPDRVAAGPNKRAVKCFMMPMIVLVWLAAGVVVPGCLNIQMMCLCWQRWILLRRLFHSRAQQFDHVWRLAIHSQYLHVSVPRISRSAFHLYSALQREPGRQPLVNAKWHPKWRIFRKEISYAESELEALFFSFSAVAVE